MEVTPPSCQEHIKNTSTWATIITENWQKNSHTTKATRKIHSKKGRKAIESRHMPLRGDSEERGEYTGDSCPGEWGVRDKDGAPVLGSYMGEMSPLTGLRTRETKKRAVGSLDSTREECAQAGCPRGRTGRSLLQQLSVSHNHPGMNPSSSRAKALALFTPCHSVSLDLEWPQPGIRLEHRRVEPGWGSSSHWCLSKTALELVRTCLVKIKSSHTVG